MESIKIKDKTFELFIPEKEIVAAIQKLAQRINLDYKGKDLLFLGILNGAFMFAAELMKEIALPCEITFIKLSSYQGTNSTGEVHQVFGISKDLAGKHIVVLEDIVDTGITIDKLSTILANHKPASVEIASLLFKPDAFKGKEVPKYVGKAIPNDFIVGYGLDYDQKGRNLRDIYKIR